MIFIDNLWAALSVMLLTTSNNKEPSIIQFGEAITQIATRMCPATSKDLLQKLDIQIKYLDALKKKMSVLFGISESRSSDIDTWLSYLDTNKTANVLCEKIKALDLQHGDLAYYEKVIKYTCLQIRRRAQLQPKLQSLWYPNPFDEPSVINLEQDPICKTMRAISNYEIGRIKQSQQCYAEAFGYCIKAIENKRDLEEAYRRLDDIYFITGTIVTQKAIAKKLLQFNLDECSRLLNNRYIKFYQDYITDREYFTNGDNESHVSYIDYLDNIDHLYNALLGLHPRYSDQDVVKFVEGLNIISKILTKDAIQEKIKDEMGKNERTICEHVHKAEGLFAVNILERQLGYIRDLSTKLDQSIYSSLKDWAKLFNSDHLNDKLKTFVQNIILCEKEKDCAYYQRVISYVEKYSSDKICVDINIQSHLCLAKRTENKNDEIEYYLDILRLNNRLLELCLGRDNAFYSTKSIKKQVCDKLGDIYYNAGNIEGAIKQFKVVGNHIKIMKCFDTLINSNEEDYSYRERKGDYLDEKGMIDSAIGCYHEALSLTTDYNIFARIHKKIASVLTSVAAKAEKYTRIGNEIATTEIAIK